LPEQDSPRCRRCPHFEGIKHDIGNDARRLSGARDDVDMIAAENAAQVRDGFVYAGVDAASAHPVQ
jgi:hypothetical protein